MFALDFTCVCANSTSSSLGYNIVLLSNVFFCNFTGLFFCLSVCVCALRVSLRLPHLTIYSKVSFSAGLLGEWYGRLLPRSISSKWSKGEFALLASSCTVAVLTFNCLSVFSANSHLRPDNCAIPGHLRLACRSSGCHWKKALAAQLFMLLCWPDVPGDISKANK